MLRLALSPELRDAASRRLEDLRGIASLGGPGEREQALTVAFEASLPSFVWRAIQWCAILGYLV